MPPRAMWTGQLRLSLVSFGVRMYAATESANRVSMNQLHKGCNQRVRQQMVCPAHGPVNREDIARGYEYEKDHYVIVEESDLEGIRLPSSKTIDLVQFVDPAEIGPLYVDAPYFLGPDGPVAEEAFRVIREAMRAANKVGIAKLVLHGREHLVALSVSGKGFIMSTLRYASEVRSPDQFFGDVKDAAVDKDQIELAQTIMKSKTAPFDPGKFQDQYQDAFFKVVKAKIEGEAPVFVPEEQAPTTFNFMDALKHSVAEASSSLPAAAKAASEKAPPAKSAKKPPAKSVSPAAKRTRRQA
jgi:DNA end-binding protein Ku